MRGEEREAKREGEMKEDWGEERGLAKREREGEGGAKREVVE